MSASGYSFAQPTIDDRPVFSPGAIEDRGDPVGIDSPFIESDSDMVGNINPYLSGVFDNNDPGDPMEIDAEGYTCPQIYPAIGPPPTSATFGRPSPMPPTTSATFGSPSPMPPTTKSHHSNRSRPSRRRGGRGNRSSRGARGDHSGRGRGRGSRRSRGPRGHASRGGQSSRAYQHSQSYRVSRPSSERIGRTLSRKTSRRAPRPQRQEPTFAPNNPNTSTNPIGSQTFNFYSPSTNKFGSGTTFPEKSSLPTYKEPVTVFMLPEIHMGSTMDPWPSTSLQALLDYLPSPGPANSEKPDPPTTQDPSATQDSPTTQDTPTNQDPPANQDPPTKRGSTKRGSPTKRSSPIKQDFFTGQDSPDNRVFGFCDSLPFIPTDIMSWNIADNEHVPADALSSMTCNSPCLADRSPSRLITAYGELDLPANMYPGDFDPIPFIPTDTLS